MKTETHFTSTVHTFFHKEWISILLQLTHHVTVSTPGKSEYCPPFFPKHQIVQVLVAVAHIPFPLSKYQWPLCGQSALSLERFLVKPVFK